MDILGVKMKDETALIIGGVGLLLIYWAGVQVKDTISYPFRKLGDLGGAVGDAVVNFGNDVESIAKKETDAAKVSSFDLFNQLNPMNKNSIFYGGVNQVGELISGDSQWTVGSWLGDALNPAQSKQKGAVALPTAGLNNNRGASGSW